MKLFPAIVLLISILYGCDGFKSVPDPPTPIEAEIIRIDIDPNPVKMNEVIMITCVLEDSVAQNLLFGWILPNSQKTISTTENTYSFIVDLEPGEYDVAVSVNDTTKNFISSNKSSYFKVINNDQ
ncbi:hypothetical protein [Gracilimonas sediminicola]|uniref:Uncharacterized protein n=1 Tax=Gracilimonas sediminicola TaxID=2952158 RepID=A0A9X2L320_9BACT|nr:hypothetical protein [Gracilimonas sediminicola]MCP9291335.1 hypothetical protein [Gracilimonas sediminicola]